MKKFITSTLIAACLVCLAAITAGAAPDGQPMPRKIPVDGPPGGELPVGDPGLVVPPDSQLPVVTSIGPASETSYPFGTTVNLSASFTDNGGTHTAVWTIDGVSFAGTVDEGAGTVSGSWTPSMPGYYIVTLTITDQSGNTTTVTTAIIIFDRGDGFMNGKGKLDIPAGSFPGGPAGADNFNYNFDTRYRKDDLVPTGAVQFKLNAGGWQFDGTSTDWFVVSFAKGLIRGTGTINGTGSYRFLISGLDGDDIGGGTPDMLRLQIKDTTGTVIFDNQMGDPDTANATRPVVGSSTIEVRLPNGGLGHLSAFQPRVESAAHGLVAGFELAQNFPNPFRASTQVRFTLPERSHVQLMVLDVAGREIATLADGPWDAGSHAVSWSGRTDAGMSASRGVYFVRIAAGLARGEQRFTSVRKMIVLD